MRKIVALLSVFALLGVAGVAPAGAAANFPPDVGGLYVFTRVVGMETPGSVTHRWLYRGDRGDEVRLEVRSPTWRTWSSKEIMGHQTGDWKVEILDGGGNVLGSLDITVGGAAQ